MKISLPGTSPPRTNTFKTLDKPFRICGTLEVHTVLPVSRKCNFVLYRLSEMIVEVLTTCHTQYT